MQRPISVADLEEGNAINSHIFFFLVLFTSLELLKVDVVNLSHSFVWINLQAQ